MTACCVHAEDVSSQHAMVNEPQQTAHIRSLTHTLTHSSYQSVAFELTSCSQLTLQAAGLPLTHRVLQTPQQVAARPHSYSVTPVTMFSSKRTTVAALAAATILAVAPAAHALDAGDQMLQAWEECAPASVTLDYYGQYLPSACGGNNLCLAGNHNGIKYCIGYQPSFLITCQLGWTEDMAAEWPAVNGIAGCPVNFECDAGWSDPLSNSVTVPSAAPYNGVSICVPSSLNDTVAAERAQLANAADRSVVFATATVDTYGQCSLNKQCKSKQDLCHGFSSQLTITDSQVSYNGKSGSDSVGFCSAADLPECSASGSCPSGYKCGSAGAAAGSNVCFPVGDAKVPAAYFAATAAPTAPATQAPATTHTATATAPPTAAPTTVHATTAATTITHSAVPTTTTAAITVCGAGLQACGSACYDPAQSSYVCQNGQLIQGTQPINTGVAGEIIDASPTTAASTQTPTQATAAATDASQPPATTAATTAATIPATTGATESPVTASGSSTVTGTSSQKTTTSAASSMLQHTGAPLLLAALSAALAL